MALPIEKAPNPVEAPLDASTVDDKKATFEIQTDSTAANPPVRQKWYQWFSPTDTPEERRLLLKLDGLILVFVFLAYWAKVLDSSATSTAYVSGMKEDLKLYGNQLNYLNTVYMYDLSHHLSMIHNADDCSGEGLALLPCRFP